MGIMLFVVVYFAFLVYLNIFGSTNFLLPSCPMCIRYFLNELSKKDVKPCFILSKYFTTQKAGDMDEQRKNDF